MSPEGRNRFGGRLLENRKVKRMNQIEIIITDSLHRSIEKELGHSNYTIKKLYSDYIALIDSSIDEWKHGTLTSRGLVKKNSFRRI